MKREELKKEVQEAVDFVREAGYPVESVDDIHEGYVSLYEVVLEVLDASGVEYDRATVEEILKELIQK